MARLGQDLRELIDLLDLDGVTLVAHSMGVSASLAMYSISRVAPVERFVAVEQSPKLTNDEHWSWGARGLDWDNVYDIAYMRAVLGQPELEPPMPEGAAMGMTEEAFDHDKVSPLRLDHLVADWRDVLPRISVPTWVVTGRLSPYYDVGGMEWFATELPDGRLTVFESSGHSPHVTEAHEFNRQLLDFVDEKR
jgi:pimeloyl-ACP methyl ester carboxylesterase